VNLLTNAVGAMETGGSATVTTAVEPGGFAVLMVEDTGHGIPEDVQQRVFEPFYTTKPEGQGTGLGLALSYGIVADHEGEIELKSEVGKGTRFRVVLPEFAE
jgi:signal transduction histidine kinase